MSLVNTPLNDAQHAALVECLKIFHCRGVALRQAREEAERGKATSAEFGGTGTAVIADDTHSATGLRGVASASIL